MISYKDIHLTTPTKEDLFFLVKCANERGLAEQKRTKKKTSIHEQQFILESLHKKDKNFVFVVSTLANNRQGICEILDIDWVHRSCFINVYFEERAEKVPVFGEKALKCLLSYVFNTLCLQKVSTNIVVDDVVMISLFKSIGFQTEVRKRQHHFSNGSHKTILEMSLLAEEFGGVQ